MKKIPFILTSLGFESKTHTLTHSEFQLTALRQSTQTQLNAHLNEFDQITIDLLGFIQPDQTWEVLLKLELKGCYRPSQMRYVHLVLEELTSSLGWHPFWIVESPAPNRSKN